MSFQNGTGTILEKRTKDGNPSAGKGSMSMLRTGSLRLRKGSMSVLCTGSLRQRKGLMSAPLTGSLRTGKVHECRSRDR